ncbi:MAG: hypothetical protein JW704_07110 [Anaerolineaceae bacterium]|nr:hypothetical protein [Anaerolineaceae bacterium]MBN2677274.1 hypothetical protein [Anaerolineaceae bacterium]
MRSVQKIPNAINLDHEITVNMDVESTYRFIINNLSKEYPNLAKGHEYFRIINKPKIEEGAIIECLESAGNQTIQHKYVVKELVENQRISYESKPSKVMVKIPGRTIESTSNTYVYYDFEKEEDSKTNIRLTITVQFANIFEKAFSQITGGMKPWKNHCIEEMEGLRQRINSKG